MGLEPMAAGIERTDGFRGAPLSFEERRLVSRSATQPGEQRTTWNGDDGDRLTKLYVDLPNHWATGGESLWARAVGDDLYELRNIPFHAYGLNYLDVVRAVPRESGGKPWVQEVETRSGHRTLRVMFYRECGRERRGRILRSLGELSVSYEGADDRYFALDLEPGADLDAVRAILDRWMEEGALDYETCEAKVAGSFDATPDAD